MRPFKRRPTLAASLAVLLAVQTAAGPASFAAADTLRPLNPREEPAVLRQLQAGLEESSKGLPVQPEPVKPQPAGTIFLRATPEGFFAAEEITGPRPVPGRGKRLQFPDPPRMGEGVDRADPQLQEKVNLLLQKIASANLDLSPSGTLNISAVKEAAQRIYPEYSPKFPDEVDSLDFGIFLDGLSWDLFSRAGEFTVFIRDPDRRVTVWRRYELEQGWERQPYLNGLGTIWVAPVRQIDTPPEDTGRTSALRAAWSPSDSFREFNKNLPGILASKRNSPALAELKKRETWIYAHSSVFFPYVYERLNREGEIQHARLASWARLFYGMESFKPTQEFALDVEAAVLPGGYVDRKVWAAQKGKMLSSADWNKQDWDKLNRMNRAILELEGKLGALARVMEEALRDPNLSPADREELAYAIFFYQWVWFENWGVRAREAIKVPGSPPRAYLPALPAFFFDYLKKKFPSAQAVIEDLNRPAPSSPIVPRGTRALELVTGFYDASFLNDDQRLKLLTAPAAGPSAELRTGLEEKSKDPRRKRTHAKIVETLQSHPGGWLAMKNLEVLAGVSLTTLSNHDYRSLVAAENERRAGMEPPRPAIELKVEDVEQAIVEALHARPGGRLTAAELAELAGVSVSTLSNHDYRSLVAAENERRAGMEPPPRPAITLLGRGRPRSAAGLEEMTREEVGRVIQALQSGDPGQASQAIRLLRNWLNIHPLPAALLERGNHAMSALVDNAFHENSALNFQSKQLIGLFFESLEKKRWALYS